MMDNYKTEQERFWAGTFGDDYSVRNNGIEWVASTIALLSKIISRTEHVHSIIEFGANVGLNMVALKHLLPAAELSAIEINEKAVNQLRQIKDVIVYHQSILDFVPDHQRDFVLTKGVLIHMNPDTLPAVYNLLHQTSKRYICVVEYYNPKPVEVNYRGHSGKLFKRDFAGELLDNFSDLRILDYGFVYHRDNNFPDDDLTWFLLEKYDQQKSALP